MIKETVKDIVVNDFRAAAVFERHGIDFCCGGGTPLDRACADKGVSVEEVRKELEQLPETDGARVSFERWDLDVLVEHIVTTHHTYVKNAIPAIMAHTSKVATVHGSRHPEVIEIFQHFQGVASELTAHMQKEEFVLFPFICTLARARREETPAPRSPFGSIANPIRMMEAEHQSAGGAMEQIRKVSSGFTPPDDACTTYRVSFQELRQFELDLHTHVHLENNILFPGAVELESTLSRR